MHLPGLLAEMMPEDPPSLDAPRASARPQAQPRGSARPRPVLHRTGVAPAGRPPSSRIHTRGQGRGRAEQPPPLLGPAGRCEPEGSRRAPALRLPKGRRGSAALGNPVLECPLARAPPARPRRAPGGCSGMLRDAPGCCRARGMLRDALGCCRARGSLLLPLFPWPWCPACPLLALSSGPIPFLIWTVREERLSLSPGALCGLSR